MILEYKMHMTAGGMKTPEWIEDGGYWGKSDHTKIGWSPDEADREYYIPDTVTELTATELETRVLAMHSDNPFQKPADNPGEDAEDMTTDEVKKMVSDWVAARES
jgi:hypothetical protein|tara:strand:+ start:342 stop:656 length:315 start_codon:yes stop_codon:yes gene_type:complete